MMQVLNVHLLLTLILFHSAGARPLDGDSTALPAKDLLLFFPLPETETPNGSHIFFVAVQQEENPANRDNNKEALRYLDPNFLLLLEHFQPEVEWAGSAPRLTRAHPSTSPTYSHQSTRSYLDVMYMPRRRSGTDLPQTLVPPPTTTPAPANKVGRSISAADLAPNQPDVAEDENPDFLSSLVTIPQVWMHDLSHMIIQPLRKNPAGERDSYEYFGMVSKNTISDEFCY